MIITYSEKLPRILKNKEQLEKRLNIKIKNSGVDLTIEGTAEDEFIAEKVIDALNFGFPFSIALMLKDEEDFMFEILPIKNYTKKSNLSSIRARIIGTEGKTLRALNQLTKCFFELKDNEIGIIGDAEHIENGQQAIISLIQGTKQANVYAYLEKHQPKPILDLGLKEKKKTRKKTK